MTTITMHTLSHCKSWPAYRAAYLALMQRTDHPHLRDSNYNAATWKERNLNVPIPTLNEQEIYTRWGALTSYRASGILRTLV